VRNDNNAEYHGHRGEDVKDDEFEHQSLRSTGTR
jgi:hypothetical protein